MSFINRQKNNKVKKLLIYSGVFLVIAILAFVFLSPTFEKNAPKIALKQKDYWNLKKPLTLELNDDREIKSYIVKYTDGENVKDLETKVISQNAGNIKLEVLPPKFNRFDKVPNEVKIRVDVSDTSKWNFFNGNQSVEDFSFKIDRKSPKADVINNSYLIRQGGSALAIVEVRDNNLEDFYITFNNEQRFELFPFYKENFFAALITWPVDYDEFKIVNLVALDKAGNKTVTKIPYYIKSMKKRVDKIKVSDSFINKVSKNVLEKSGYDIPASNADAFIMSNQELRKENVQTLYDVSRNAMDLNSSVSEFKVNVFRQLRGSKNFANFGERRHYYYNGQKIDEAWHLGMDWASVKNAKVYASNAGKVIFKDYLGIYGNTVIVDHGFGLASLYSHTSRLNVELYDDVSVKQQIGNTGSTGAVFGDHLHFGMLVQGLEVNPLEWMDRKWINTNITKILKQSKKVIDSK